MKKRMISLLLAFSMILGMIPVSAFAVNVAGNEIDITNFNIVNAIEFGSVTISGATVFSAEETGSYSLNVVLAQNTAPGTKLTATFNVVRQSLRSIVQNNTCTLNANGDGSMKVEIAATPNGSQIIGKAGYTITFSTLKGESVDVTLPTGDGFTVTGKESAYVNSSYGFTVALEEGYKAGADFAVKVNGETVGTEPGSFTVDVSEALTITVEGVVAKKSFAVELPTGVGFAATGADSVYEGDSYSFTVAILEGYTAGTEFAVKVNDETVGTEPGSFTVENVNEDLTVTVEGIEVHPLTEVRQALQELLLSDTLQEAVLPETAAAEASI